MLGIIGAQVREGFLNRSVVSGRATFVEWVQPSRSTNT